MRKPIRKFERWETTTIKVDANHVWCGHMEHIHYNILLFEECGIPFRITIGKDHVILRYYYNEANYWVFRHILDITANTSKKAIVARRAKNGNAI